MKYLVVSTGWGVVPSDYDINIEGQFDSIEDAKEYLSRLPAEMIEDEDEEEYELYNESDSYFEIEFEYDAHFWAKILEVK